MTLGAVLFEFGLPVAAGVAFWRMPSLRSRLIVVLGTITPLVVLHLSIVISYLADPTDANRFAFYAGWEMSFVAYSVCVIFGAVLSLLERPVHILARYLMGLAVIPAAVLLLRFVP